MNETVIIGAGPVGLWTAIQIKKRQPSLNITVYERYETYQRSHVLRLDHWSMILYQKNKRDSLEKAFIHEVTGCSLPAMKAHFADSLYIKTNDFEAALKRYALGLGVSIVLQKIESPDMVEALHPHCTHFIAADGAHSIMRKHLLGEDAVTNYPLQHVIELKFHVPHKTSKITKLSDIFRLNAQNEYMHFEYVGRFKDEKTPITTRFFLPEELYNHLPDASFKQPLAWSQLLESPHTMELYQHLQNYLDYRKNIMGDIIPNDIYLTKLVLSMYSATQFAIKRGSTAWFLTGDAAMGVPYFRALNSGMILSSRLAQILSKPWYRLGDPLETQISFYNIHQKMHIDTEFSIAYGKNSVLNMFNHVRNFSFI